MKRLTIMLTASWITLTGCSDDSSERIAAPGTGPSILGDWELVEVSGTPRIDFDGSEFAYMLFVGDNFVTFEEDRMLVMNERGLGFRQKYETTAVVAGDVAEIEGVEVPFTVTETELTLDDGVMQFRFERSESAPDFDEWVRDYKIENTIGTPNQSIGDIAIEESALWVAGGPADEPLARVDLTSMQSSTFAVDDIHPYAIDIVAGGILGDNFVTGGIHRIFPDTGNTVSLGITFGRNLMALVRQEGTRYLWGVSDDTRRIYAYDVTDREIVAEMRLGPEVGPRGGTHVGDRLYLVAAGVVTEFVVDADIGGRPTLDAVGAFHLPDNKILGVAHDGTRFWVNARNHGTGGMMLHAIRPAATEETGR